MAKMVNETKKAVKTFAIVTIAVRPELPMKSAAIVLATIALLSACDSLPNLNELGNRNQPAAVESANNVTQTESDRLNAFFEETFNAGVARSPMTQTFLGIKDDYDKWDDANEANILREIEIQRENVGKMRAEFDFERLDESAKLSWRLAEYELEQAERDFEFRDHAYVFNQMRGLHSWVPAFLINQHRIDTKSDAEAYISRLNGIPVFLGTEILRAEELAEDGVMPPKFVYEYTIEASQNLIKGYPFGGADYDDPSPLMDDFRKKISALENDKTITQQEASKLRADADIALRNAVGPTYERLIAVLETQAESAGTDDGVWRLPRGNAYYAASLANMTTTNMTAGEIHDLGLSEVDRIHSEMRDIMAAVDYDGTLQDFFEFLRTDEQFYYPDTDEGRLEYIETATALIDAMRDDLPRMFNTFPQADMIVKRVEPFRERAAGKAFYQRPAPDGSRPGIYYANLYDMSAMPIYQMEALAYHEGIPGHHMQIAISQELEGLPKFRKFGGYTAYSEGWGLYTEFLPKELGYYDDPYSDFGRLAMELWRAARLVVDTGLHDKRWTREEAIQYLIDNTPNPEWDCRKAIDRYIVMPGQATAYKIGMLKLLELREDARDSLGDRFTLADYHDVVLKDGPVPLSILEENVEAWIVETRQD
ncbi:MAG: DUF885 domain-containing protein [Pseudomonadota bacterium]